MTIRYTKDHEWIRIEGAVAVVGISDYAQSQLGDIVFVDLPEPGKKVDAGDEVAVVESVKAASEVYAPVGGEVVETNPAIVEDPSLVNQSPMEDGWFVKLKISDPDALDSLMDQAAYDAYLQTL
ncbi:glycine cleavage system protein GcvH [uncultured Ferrovibrio sp.]|mgnify:CR=1 FL=1|jgi:glycine cleavage system H protein|uniref:glycine cleavage system protein GcvH n=1 Tax=uncultured Ferrovibrio sp. TaxID=1576913 RepID=UPI00262DE18B|nr:glycine cleavage system protein GcvH [uncultured Ferrovibrio sp.]